MSATTKCGIACDLCDCGTTNNPCKFKAAKTRYRMRLMGFSTKPKQPKKKRSKRGRK